MINMSAPPTFPGTHRLNSRTLASTADRLELAVNAARRAGVQFRGRKIGAEALINAAVMTFLDLSEAERADILRSYLPQIEAELEAQPDASSDAPQVVGDYRLGEIVDLNPVSSPKPYRKNKGTNPPKPPSRKP
jgi:hypothetical protein